MDRRLVRRRLYDRGAYRVAAVIALLLLKMQRRARIG